MQKKESAPNFNQAPLNKFSSGCAHASYDFVAGRLSADSSSNSHEIFCQGSPLSSMQVKLYAPPTPDAQQPHERDEIYIVAEGSGEFLMEEKTGDKIISVQPNDFIFVPAGVPHRFINFSNLKVWVFFY